MLKARAADGLCSGALACWHSDKATAPLPDKTMLSLEAWHVDEAVAEIMLHVTSTQACAPCPLCHKPGQSILSTGAELTDFIQLCMISMSNQAA
jgi:hypothetical protein